MLKQQTKRLSLPRYYIFVQTTNKWDVPLYYTLAGYANGRPYWIDINRTYAFWYHGHTGSDFDWFFGLIEKIGRDHQTADAIMASDEETACPTDVATWTIDPNARVECGKLKSIIYIRA